MRVEEIKVMAEVKRIIAKGNSVEIKGNKDGTYKVYEVKKNIAIG